MATALFPKSVWKPSVPDVRCSSVISGGSESLAGQALGVCSFGAGTRATVPTEERSWQQCLDPSPISGEELVQVIPTGITVVGASDEVVLRRKLVVGGPNAPRPRQTLFKRSSTERARQLEGVGVGFAGDP